MSVDSISAAWAADEFPDLPARAAPAPAPVPVRVAPVVHPLARASSRPFAAEWFALVSGLALTATLIGWSLFKSYDTVDLTERDRLRTQARVVDDNIGQQIDG